MKKIGLLLVLNLVLVNLSSAKLADRIKDVGASVAIAGAVTNSVCAKVNKGKLDEKSQILGDEKVSEIEKAKGIKCEFKKQRRDSLTRIYNCDHNKKVVIKFNLTPCKPDRMTISKVKVRRRLF